MGLWGYGVMGLWGYYRIDPEVRKVIRVCPLGIRLKLTFPAVKTAYIVFQWTLLFFDFRYADGGATSAQRCFLYVACGHICYHAYTDKG